MQTHDERKIGFDFSLIGLIACYSVNLSFILLGFYGIIIAIILYFSMKKAIKDVETQKKNEFFR